MKRILLYIFILMFALLGCKRDPMPRNAIERDTFVNILVDVHLAEAISRDQYRLKLDSIESTSMYLAVLDKYMVSEAQMLATSLYYSRNQREYKKIYNDVLDKISMMIEDNNKAEEVIIDTDSVGNVKTKKLVTPSEPVIE